MESSEKQVHSLYTPLILDDLPSHQLSQSADENGPEAGIL